MSEPIDQAKLEQSLHEAYAPGTLPFCHDPKYPMRQSDRWLCSLSEAEQQRCPAFKKLCATTPPPEPKREASSNGDASSFSGLGMVAEVVFWLLIAGLVVALLLALKRMLDARRDPAEAAAERTSREPQAQSPAAALPSGDTDVQRLLEKARRAAERGELGVAIDSAYAAAVQGLSAAGRVEVDRDRTNGDYVRDLRADPPLQREFKAIVGRVEVAQFGGAVPSRSTFDQVLEQVHGLLRRLAVLTLLALSLGALQGCAGAGGAGQERAELAPHGLHTLRKLLGDLGSNVHLRVAPLNKLDDDVAEVIVYDTTLEDEARALLLHWLRGGGSVVLVGRDQVLEDEALVDVRQASCGRALQQGPARNYAPLDVRVLGQASIELKPLPESSVSHHVVAACDSGPYVVSAFVGEGVITFLPEPELLSNASLSVAGNARFVVEQLAAPGATIELVGPWTGDGSESPVEAIKAAGLLPVLLQLLALVGLLALRQGTSFGARRDVARRVRRAFADHVRAVAATYARARAGRLVSANYGMFLIDQLREKLCPGQRPTLFQLAAIVARRVGRPETEIVTLLVEAKSAFDEPREGEGVNHEVLRELEQLSLQAGGKA